MSSESSVRAESVSKHFTISILHCFAYFHCYWSATIEKNFSATNFTRIKSPWPVGACSNGLSSTLTPHHWTTASQDAFYFNPFPEHPRRDSGPSQTSRRMIRQWYKASACYASDLYVTSGSISVKSDPASCSIRRSCAVRTPPAGFPGPESMGFWNILGALLSWLGLTCAYATGSANGTVLCGCVVKLIFGQILSLALRLFVNSKESLGSLIQTNMTGNVVWSSKTGFVS